MSAQYKTQTTQNLTKVYCAIKVVTTTKLTWDKNVFWERLLQLVSLVERTVASVYVYMHWMTE